MKLMNCIVCNDIQALTLYKRTCHCGKSNGKYLNQEEVIVFGPCRVIGIRNDEYHVSLALRDSTKDYKWFEISPKL